MLLTRTSMKKMNQWKALGLLAIALTVVACSDDNNDTDTPSVKPGDEYVWSTDAGIKACNRILFTDGKADPNGKEIGNGDQEIVFTGKQTLKKGTYLLKGWVYVGKGAELTIEPGTVIKGDKDTKAALIVERGGKLFAQGTPTQPIVFTSEQEKGQRKPGDWGGIILCGNALNNQKEMQIEGGPRTKHGGNDDQDNSGVLSYVRIEFAGYPFQKDKEINGLTFGSVGSGTTVDHIQVSYSNDDSYEWFGGTVNAKYLVAYKGWDDDFDTDNGYSGKVQFGLVIRDPRIADGSQSNGFESDNSADGSNILPFTAATFSNITFIGPKADPSFQNNTDYINGGDLFPNNGSALGKFQAAMHLRRNTRLNCFNSVAVGFPVGLILDNEKGNTQGNAKDGNMTLNNIWFADMDVVGTDGNKVYEDALLIEYGKPNVFDYSQRSFSSTYFLAQSGNRYVEDLGQLLINGFMPAQGSPLLTAAAFNHTLLNGWFTKVPYIGAFHAGDNWLDGWTEFDPQHADYR